jgi:hypothetical protein
LTGRSRAQSPGDPDDAVEVPDGFYSAFNYTLELPPFTGLRSLLVSIFF